jgi:precorrin-2 dehydrogenase/sirohydrochlorin ferrochelatase
MIPLVHDFAGERVVIVGGGSVGARKARLFGNEAETVLFSPDFPAEDYGDAALVRVRVTPETAPAWVSRTAPALVVTATADQAVNEALARAARDSGALVNRADQSGPRDVGSVVVPATVRDEPVTVAVTTGGRSPALSRYLREEIEAQLHSSGDMARLTASIRDDLKSQEVEPTKRQEAIRSVVRSQAVWKALRGGTANARREAEDIVQDIVKDR